MVIRATLLFLLCSSIFATQAQLLSELQAIRIADKAARSAVHRDISEFSRSAVYYDVHRAEWSVYYKSITGSPSEFCVRVSDSTRKTEVIPGNKLIYRSYDTI
jgi:hypothetical protein